MNRVIFCDESEITGFNDGLDTAISALATLPSANKKGNWNYCPNCGAEMGVAE